MQFAMATLALVVGTSITCAETTRKPNVLFIISDDLSCDLGCYGNTTVHSPHIDALAKTGVRFDRAYVQYSVCNPSRASFLTGLRPTTTKILDNTTHFRKTMPNVKTLPQLFRENGYESVGLGKIFHRGLSPDDVKQEMDDPNSFDRVFYGTTTTIGNTGQGRNLTGDKLAWCRWLAAEGTDADQADGQLADEAVKTLAEKRNKPLFLAVGFYRPHDPFIVPKKYFDRYDRDKLELPTTPDGYTPPFPHSLGGGAFKTAFDKFTDRERREFLHSYYAGVSFMDAQVGKLIAALKANNLHENTIVVFIGDHGYELGYRGWWNKNTLFERSCRTPLIIYDPAARGNGSSTSTITEFVDLYPTLAARCGLNGLPKNLEGADFRQVLDNPKISHKAAAVTVVQRGKFLGRSIRTERYRFTAWDGGAKGFELYDHTKDPGEWNNLAVDPQSARTLAELKKQLDAICPATSGP